MTDTEHTVWLRLRIAASHQQAQTHLSNAMADNTSLCRSYVEKPVETQTIASGFTRGRECESSAGTRTGHWQELGTLIEDI